MYTSGAELEMSFQWTFAFVWYPPPQKKSGVENSEETPLIGSRVYRADGKGTKHVMSCSLLATSLLPHSLLEGMPPCVCFPFYDIQ